MSTPLYARITAYCDPTYGEDMRCVHPYCREVRAVCPDCSAPVCVFCEDGCAECGGLLF